MISVVTVKISRLTKRICYVILLASIAIIIGDILAAITGLFNLCKIIQSDIWNTGSYLVKWGIVGYWFIITQLPLLALGVMLLVLSHKVKLDKTTLIVKKLNIAGLALIFYVIVNFFGCDDYFVFCNEPSCSGNSLSLLIWGPIIMQLIGFRRVQKAFEDFTNFQGLYVFALPFYAYLVTVIYIISYLLIFEIVPTNFNMTVLHWLTFGTRQLALILFFWGLFKAFKRNNEFILAVPTAEYVSYFSQLKTENEKKDDHLAD